MRQQYDYFVYIQSNLDLLQSISHDDIFTKMEDFIVQTQRARGGVEVSEFVQKWLNQGRNEGISIVDDGFDV